MPQRRVEILERALRVLSEQAVKADGIVDEALAAGLGGSHQVVTVDGGAGTICAAQ